MDIKKISGLVKTLLVIVIFISIGFTLIYPIGYIDLVLENSKKYDLDPILVFSIINVESKFNKYAKSHKNARGLMQIGEETGRWGASELLLEGYEDKKLFEPEINIEIGCWYLKKLTKEFNGRMDLVLAAYNAGSGNVTSWLSNPDYSFNGINLDYIPFKETEDYLVKIEEIYKIYDKYYSVFIKKNITWIDFYFNQIIKIRLKIKEYIN